MFKCFCDACEKEVQQDKQSSAIGHKLKTSKLKTQVSFSTDELSSPHVCHNCQIVAIEDLLRCIRLNRETPPKLTQENKNA